MERIWQNVKEESQPDIVHIHGTEFPHGLAYVRACGANHVVVSIQGLVSVIARYILGGLNVNQLSRYITPRDIVKSSVLSMPKTYRERGEYERELISRVKHIIGRTSWDREHVWAINSKAEYHACNEILRDGFYKATKWNINTCNKHRLFLSQVYSPLKGAHMVIQALPLILKEFPDTQLYIAGVNPMKHDTLKEKIKFKTYPNYLYHQLKDACLMEHVHFTGALDERQMIDQYLKSHIFLCPSSIENSSNSIGEAQLLGVPCVASYVGGTPDMITDGRTGLLYRFEEYEMLAYNICQIFKNDRIAQELSLAEIAVATQRHDRRNNAIRMMEIYKNVIE